MTLREGRAELHQRLIDAARTQPVDGGEGTYLALLLTDAAQAILTCPIEGCAYCWNVTQAQREEQP